MNKKSAILALEDGFVLHGRCVGVEGETEGEVVFNTGMTGYQEILTDPSYAGQIVTMTYPHIGNYGVNAADAESHRPHVAGFVMKEMSRMTSNWQAEGSLAEYFQQHKIVAIDGVDTRALTRRLRTRGVMRGIISSREANPKKLIERAKQVRSMVGANLASQVSCKEPYRAIDVLNLHSELLTLNSSFKVVAIDCGIKYNILRMLVASGCDVTVVPASTSAKDILAHRPDGLFISNGPGDPEVVTEAIEATRSLIGKLPIFGICLGHQILGLALGAKTYKMKFGHRGENQPVKNLETGQVEITSHNHGFAVDAASLPADVAMTHLGLNDQTCEGFRHKTLPILAIQYHPEAAPGPHDASYLFKEFTMMMEKVHAQTH